MSEKKGSVTVEAIMVMPVAFMILMFFVWFMDSIRVHTQVEAIISEAGCKMVDCSYAYGIVNKGISEEESSRIVDIVSSVGVSQLYLQNLINQRLGDQIKNLMCSVNIDTEHNELAIYAVYQVRTSIALGNINAITLSNSFYSRGYCGFSEHNKSSGYIFITKGSAVYHTSKECSSLKRQVSPVVYGEIGKKRNEDGGKYYLCSECCKGENPKVVYVTAHGTRYHSDPECKDLTIRIYTIPIEEKGDRRKCYFCE